MGDWQRGADSRAKAQMSALASSAGGFASGSANDLCCIQVDGAGIGAPAPAVTTVWRTSVPRGSYHQASSRVRPGAGGADRGPRRSDRPFARLDRADVSLQAEGASAFAVAIQTASRAGQRAGPSGPDLQHGRERRTCRGGCCRPPRRRPADTENPASRNSATGAMPLPSFRFERGSEAPSPGGTAGCPARVRPPTRSAPRRAARRRDRWPRSTRCCVSGLALDDRDLSLLFGGVSVHEHTAAGRQRSDFLEQASRAGHGESRRERRPDAAPAAPSHR